MSKTNDVLDMIDDAVGDPRSEHEVDKRKQEECSRAGKCGKCSRAGSCSR